MRDSFWPYSRRAAFVASLVLVPVLLLLVVVASEQGYGGLGGSAWPLFVAVIVGLIPVLALVLGGVDSVQAAGVKVAFAAVQEVVAKTSDVSTRALLAQNLGQPPGQVGDSGSDTVIQTLSSVTGNTVVVVDLQEGDAWWSTRLLLLASGAARLNNPKAIVFVRAEPNRPQAFLGWAEPTEVLRRLLLAEPELQAPHWRADRNTLIWRLSTPTDPGAARQPPWPGAAVPHVDHPDQFVPERLLRDELRTLEQSGRDLRVTIGRLQDYLGSVLHTDAIDRGDHDENWLNRLVESRAGYIAITSDGQFVNLAPREAALNALLLSLLEENDATRRAG